MGRAKGSKIDPRSLLTAPKFCPYCNSAVKYTSHAEIYGGREFSDWPYIYLCTKRECRASVGVHKGTNHPLGTLADEKTKKARCLAHATFDPLWKSGKMSRGEAYKWLADQLGLERWRTHISWFDASYCQAVVKAVASRKPA